MSTKPPLPNSTVVNGYRIMEQVGQGGFGRVYKAQLVANPTWVVAIKELYVTNPDAIARFQQEANMMRGLMHPNIPLVDNYFIHDDRFCLVVRWVEAHAWHKCAASRRNQRDITLVAMGALDGLGYLHSKGIVHRDVKPANILPEWNPPHVYIVDLGVARDQKDARQAATQVGTLNFISPQQALGEAPHVTDDLLGLGASMFYMMAPDGTAHDKRVIPSYGGGVTPPAIETMLSAYADRFSLGFRQVVLRSLQYRREDRFSDAASMHKALEQTLDDDGSNDDQPPGDLPPIVFGPDPASMATTSDAHRTTVGTVSPKKGWNPRRS